MGCLIYFEIIKLWEILLIVFINGAVGGVRLPTREALLLDVVGKIDLVKAISTTFLLYTVLGFLIPIITGNLIEINMSIVYFICSALIFLSFLFIKNLSVINNYSEHSSSTGLGLKEVIKYIYDNHLIKQILIIMLFSEIFGWSHNSMIPVMVRDIFKLPASNLFSGALGKYFGVEFSIILLGVILISASVYSIFKLKKVDEKVQDIQSQIKNA